MNLSKKAETMAEPQFSIFKTIDTTVMITNIPC